MKRISILAGALCVLALMLSACGGGGSSSSSSATSETEATSAASAEGGESGSAESGSASAGLKEAEAVVAKLKLPPKELELAKLSKVPPKGKTIALLGCPLPSCALFGKAMRPAASLLGWSVEEVSGGLTPESYVAGMEQILQKEPDYIALNALQPNSVIEKQLQEAEEKGIPVFECAGSDPPEGPVKAIYFGPSTFEALGKSLAESVIAESGGEANAVLVNDPAQKSFVAADESFKKEYARLCPECQLGDLPISYSNIGKTIPQQVISYLQKNPETNYVVSTFTEVLTGVPQAIKGAGLAESTNVMATLSQVSDYPLVEENDPPYSVIAVEQAAGYRGTDAFARISVGEEPTADPQLPQQLITAESISTVDTSTQWSVPNLAKSFATSWGVTIPSGFEEFEK